MKKEDKIVMLGWIQETFNDSNDLFERSLYEIKHWMEEEIGVYVSEAEFAKGFEEAEFKRDGEFFYIKLAAEAGPIVVNKVYPLSKLNWDETCKEEMKKRLLQ